jgi:hypothetical protein
MYTLLFPLALSVISVSAHSMSDGVGCCGDIPESLIWTMSFFVLIGILIVIGSYSLNPSYPLEEGCNNNNNTAIQVRISDKDIDRIARAVTKYQPRDDV